MPGDFLTFTVPYLGLLFLSDAVMAYSSYLAYLVWRGLAVPAYRQRALWTSILAALVLVTFTYGGVVQGFYLGFSGPYNRAGPAGSDLLYILLTSAVFVWVDRTLAGAIRLDFYRRDLLGWRRFRGIYWALMFVSFGTYIIGYYALPAFNYFPPAYFLAILGVAVAVPLAYASACLVAGSRRTRDETFRMHATWFGLFAVSLAFQALLYVFLASLLANMALLLAEAYCLFRMSRYLVPVNRLPPVTPEPMQLA